MLRSDPVDPAVPLHEAHRVPGQVEVDDRAGLLEVLALGEDIGREEQIDLLDHAGWGARRQRDERPDDVLASLGTRRPGCDADPAAVASHPLISGRLEEPVEVVDCIGEVAEQDDLALVGLGGGRVDPGQRVEQRVELRIVGCVDSRRAGEQRPQQIAVSGHPLAKIDGEVFAGRSRVRILGEQQVQVLVVEAGVERLR